MHICFQRQTRNARWQFKESANHALSGISAASPTESYLCTEVKTKSKVSKQPEIDYYHRVTMCVLNHYTSSFDSLNERQQFYLSAERWKSGAFCR